MFFIRSSRYSIHNKNKNYISNELNIVFISTVQIYDWSAIVPQANVGNNGMDDENEAKKTEL